MGGGVGIEKYIEDGSGVDDIAGTDSLFGVGDRSRIDNTLEIGDGVWDNGVLSSVGVIVGVLNKLRINFYNFFVCKFNYMHDLFTFHCHCYFP